MIIYAPVYDKGWSVQRMDTTSKHFRTWKSVGYDRTIIYNGWSYNGSHAFTTEDSAWKFINEKITNVNDLAYRED